jgi:hypothetical protein
MRSVQRWHSFASIENWENRKMPFQECVDLMRGMALRLKKIDTV